MFADNCTHKTDNTGHCLDPTCKNYALYHGEEQRQAVIVLRKRQALPVTDEILETIDPSWAE